MSPFHLSRLFLLDLITIQSKQYCIVSQQDLGRTLERQERWRWEERLYRPV